VGLTLSTHAPFPGARAARPLWLGLYGPFSPYASEDREPSEVTADAYLLFYARSRAMGWLTDALRPDPVRLWGMNEAELEPTAAGSPPLVAWFQVVLTEPSGVDGLLPS
jgi:hypothetical protein